jgi:hypothetical protein
MPDVAVLSNRLTEALGIRHPIVSAAFEFRVGGEWDFVMHGPDGLHRVDLWIEIAPPDRAAPR